MATIAQLLANSVGESLVIPWEACDQAWRVRVQRAIAPDATAPACIAYPETPEQLAAVVACAHQNQWRLLPCGRGSKLNWGALVEGVDVVISTERMHRLIDHAAGDLTLTVEAGATFAAMQKTLRQAGQFLAIDPAYPEQATLGGIVASRNTGALRQRYGGLRDMLIGVSFVRHDGLIAKAGGRVVKNVAGYDLMKLMTGAFGTLGILTQLTFRTYPLAESSATMLLTGAAANLQAATAAVLRSGLTPVALDVLSPGLLLEGDRNTYGLAAQFQTIAAGVAEQIERMRAIAHAHQLNYEVLDTDADPEFWQRLTATLFPQPTPSLPQDEAAIAQLGIPLDQAVDLLLLLDKTLTPDTWQARLHAGSGVGTLRCLVAENTVQQLLEVRSHCQRQGGYLIVLHSPPAWKTHLDPWMLSDDTRFLMDKLKAQFDPQGQFSPGRFG